MKIYKEHLVFAAGILVSLAIGSWLGGHLDEGGKATVDGKRPIPILIGNQTIDSQRQKLIPESPKTSTPPDLPKTPKGVPDTQNEQDPQKPLTVPKQTKQDKQGKQTKQVDNKQKESNNEQQQEETSTRPR